MKTDRFLSAKLALVLLPVLLTFGAKGAIAQITPANDGTGTKVAGTQQLNITGGTQAGGNLFHSFQQFGVNAGQTANFLSNPNTQNILGRVTGGNSSLINGLLQVSGSNANLYLVNPAGIVFGKNASLNVPAAFTATTANGIGFGNGQWFNATGSNNYAALTSNPNGFGFIGLSGSLVNAGNLSVNPGQSIALIGGTVVNTGTISAPGGNITIAAIPGEKMVRIGQDGMVLSLDLPMSDRTLINAPIATPLSLPALLTGGSVPSAMGVVVEDGVIKLKAGSAEVGGTLNADGVGTQNGGNVVAYADNHLNFTGVISAKGGELGGNGGFVDTSGKGLITIAPTAKVVTTAVKGLTGNWVIDPTDLEVVAGTGGAIVTGTNSPTTASTIGASTIVLALDTSNVELKADNSITVNAAIDDSSPTTNSSSLKLTALTVNLNEEIKLNKATLSGTATTVNVGTGGTVQNGVDVAAANGTVNLAAATYTLTQTVNISKNLTVKGAGQTNTTVSGNDTVRVFQTTSGTTVAFNDLKITRGNSADFGGGIYNDGALTLTNSTVSDNRAGIYGGGIYSNGGLTLTNSTVSDNRAVTSGGGISNLSGSAVTLVNSTISGNTVGFYGGGISNIGDLTITNSTISMNTAGAGGGGIATNTATLVNSTVSGNTTGGDGGGIYSDTAVSLTNSIVSGNTATSGSGGGILGIGAIVLADSIISNNMAGANGGGILSIGNVSLTNTTASSNMAGGRGAGIYSSRDISLTNSNVSGNTAGDYGGGIFSDAGITTLINSTVSGNTVSTNSGGGIYGRGDVSLTNGTVSGNTANGNGGGIYSDGVVSLTNSTISGNTATIGSGGGIFGVGAIILSNSTVSNNTTGFNGGGILGVSPVTLTNSTVSGNTANNGGGGISSNGGTITSSTITKNTGVAGDGGIFSFGTLAIENSIVAGNVVNGGQPSDLGGTGLVNGGNNIIGMVGGYDSIFAPSSLIGTSADPVDPKLAPLGNYGGPTQTHALLPGSLAIDAGDATITTADQRGVAPAGKRDIGAYESKGFGLLASNGTQSTTVNTAFANPLKVNFVETAFNSPLPVSGVTINFTPSTSAASAILNPTTAVITDSTGAAQVLAIANTKAGTYNVQANTTGIPGTIFSLTNQADVANSITTTSGSGQTTLVDTNFANSLIATVTDKFGNPVKDSTVAFSLPGTGSSGVFTSNTAITDIDGKVSIGIKANTRAGSFTTTGKVANVTTGADFNLTNIADVANSITTTSGSGQTTVVDTNFANNLIATVTDKFGNPVKDSTVTFSLPGTGSSGVFLLNTAVTDVDGKVSIGIKANTKAGSFTTTGKVANVTTGADFNLTNIADRPYQIKLLSAPETKRSGQVFTSIIRTQILDQFNNPIVNQSVLFTLPNTGASGSFSNGSTTISLITDATGTISTSLTANAFPGNYNITAQISSGPTTQIPLSNSKIQTEGLYTGKEISKQESIEAPTSNVLCAIKKASTPSSQNDPYKGIPACGNK